MLRPRPNSDHCRPSLKRPRSSASYSGGPLAGNQSAARAAWAHARSTRGAIDGPTGLWSLSQASPKHGATARQGGLDGRALERRGDRGGWRHSFSTEKGCAAAREGSGSCAWWWSMRYWTLNLVREAAQVSTMEGGGNLERRTAVAAYRR
jgi:hypothetical protein